MKIAKDGTGRGGKRAGAGRKSKPLIEKINAGLEATVLDLPMADDLTGNDMPPVKDYMKEKQKDGEELYAEEIYTETWEWLKKFSCEQFVGTQLLNQYAMSVSRWIQCEKAISRFGFLAKHPTTGQAIASPYVSMSQNYMKQVNQIWYQIYDIVKENSSVNYEGATPQDDVMEKLLRTRKR